jgi:hypothetical protein
MPKRGARRAVQPARPCFLHQNALVWLGSTHHSLERYGGMGRCPTSAQKFDGRRKFRPERFHRFQKIQKKSAKFGKIWPKRTRDDGGIVEIRNTKIWPVLVIYQPTSSINRWFFPKFAVAIFGRIFQKPGEFCRKSVNGKKKLWKTTTWHLLNLYIRCIKSD